MPSLVHFILDHATGLMPFKSLSYCGYLVVERIGLREVHDGKLDSFTFGSTALDVGAVYAEVEPLLVRAAVTVKTH